MDIKGNIFLYQLCYYIIHVLYKYILQADQLTSFYNTVEEGKEAYNNILSNLKVSSSSNIMNLNKSLESEEKLKMNLDPKKAMSDNKTFVAKIQDESDDSDNMEENLDFLLSLESPSLQSNKKQMPLTNVLSKNGNLINLFLKKIL